MYDIVVVGAGPAGLTAGANCAQRGLKTLILEGKKAAGGQPMNFYPNKIIIDHPGFPRGIMAQTLCERLYRQACESGAEIHLFEPVRDLRLHGRKKKVITREGEYECKRIILCTGLNAIPKKLYQLDDYNGKHLHYYIERSVSFKRKNVLVVGGGDVAVERAIELSKVARSVAILVREKRFKAKLKLVKMAMEKNIEIFFNSELVIINDEKKTVIIKDLKRKKKFEYPVDEVVVSVGSIPTLGLYKNKGLRITKNKHIWVNSQQMTSVSGVFAAGDITSEINLIATACSDGIVAAINTFKEIKEPFWLNKLNRRPGTQRRQ